MRRRLMLATAVAALAMIGPGVAGSGVAGAATAGWTLGTVPLPAGVNHAALYGVSCAQAADCTAVGAYLHVPHRSLAALAERWDGSSWSAQTVPAPAGSKGETLDAVSCSSSADCTAVGDWAPYRGAERALAEHWNGTSWAVQSTPRVAGAIDAELLSLSCASATDCTAVGDSTGAAGTTFALAERWNGSRWAIQAALSPYTDTLLSSVDCVSASWCTAVGYSGNGLIAEYWNGSGWSYSVPPSPVKNLEGESLNSISCPSAKVCDAVGFDSGTKPDQLLAERWSGGKWAVVTTPLPSGSSRGGLSGVSCTSADSCTATGWAATMSGTSDALAEYWNGTAWTVEPTATPASRKSLQAVSCTAAHTCAAVGARPNLGEFPDQNPLAEQQ
jgi:hypothetical protein